MGQPSGASEVPEPKSFNGGQIPFVALQTQKNSYSTDQEYLFCAFSKHHQHTSVIPQVRQFLQDSDVGPDLQTSSLGHNVLAEQDANLELNLFLLARKLLPAYHDGAPQNCQVCEIFCSRMAIFVIVFSPAISPCQKFNKGST
jgi:hypothetical protein